MFLFSYPALCTLWQRFAMSIRLPAMPTAVQKTAELGSHNTERERETGGIAWYRACWLLECTSRVSQLPPQSTPLVLNLAKLSKISQLAAFSPDSRIPGSPYITPPSRFNWSRLIDDLFILIGGKSLLTLVRCVDFANASGPKYHQLQAGVFLLKKSVQGATPSCIVFF